MTTIKTKQGNELALETFDGAVYVRTPKGAYKVDSFEYVSGKVSLLGLGGGFILNGLADKVTLATIIDFACGFTNAVPPSIPLLDESALDESLAALEGICNGLR